MTEKLAKSDMGLLPGAIGRNLPRRQVFVDVLVQIQFALLDESHCSEREDWFANRSGLKQGRLSHRASFPPLLNPEPSRPVDLVIIYDGDAHTRRVIISHSVRERRLGAVLVIQGGFRQKPINYSLDSTLDLIGCRTGALCRYQVAMHKRQAHRE